IKARVRVDGGRVFEPALNQFPFATQAIGTPSVRTGFFDDVYLTLVQGAQARGGPVTLAVIVQPLVMWLWVGGGIMAIGTLMAAVRRDLQDIPARIAQVCPAEPELVG